MSSFFFVKFQLMNCFILGAIGHEVISVPRRSEPEQQIWCFLFEGFRSSNEVVLFLESLNRFKFVLKFCSGFYDVFF